MDTKQSKMNKKRVSREFLKSLRSRQQKERETPAGPRPGSVSVATYSGHCRIYDSLSDVGEIRVYQRADFQSGSRVLKKVF